MATNTGEQVFDALLSLGFELNIADDGTITASKGAQTLRGKAQQGTIEWTDRSLTYQVIEQAYIAKLRLRITEARVKATQQDIPKARIDADADAR